MLEDYTESVPAETCSKRSSSALQSFRSPVNAGHVYHWVGHPLVASVLSFGRSVGEVIHGAPEHHRP